MSWMWSWHWSPLTQTSLLLFPSDRLASFLETTLANGVKVVEKVITSKFRFHFIVIYVLECFRNFSCIPQSSRKTFWPTSHSDFLSCRIQESECKFTGPNKNKNNFTCLLLYQLAANCLFSHKNIKLFLQLVALNFPFLILVMQINCIYIFLNIVCQNKSSLK
jgi:hypothetical protein